MLRKDFVVDPYQVWEAAAAGAAAVLLITAALDDAGLRRLAHECDLCGLDALIEVHDGADMRRAVAAGATLIGINNRDLRTLAVDLATTATLAPLSPPDALVVSESGIVGPAGARRAAGAGAHALLVGEALVRCPAADLQGLVSSLRGAKVQETPR
jgi:indole-3-glycerol phosphate synthase